jgi:hypothetical protein
VPTINHESNGSRESFLAGGGQNALNPQSKFDDLLLCKNQFRILRAGFDFIAGLEFKQLQS